MDIDREEVAGDTLEAEKDLDNGEVPNVPEREERHLIGKCRNRLHLFLEKPNSSKPAKVGVWNMISCIRCQWCILLPDLGQILPNRHLCIHRLFHPGDSPRV